MKYIKLYEEIDIDFDDIVEEEENTLTVYEEIRQVLINDLSINNIRSNKEIMDIIDKYNYNYDDICNDFDLLNEYSKLYDDIDYEEIKRGSIVIATMINVDKYPKRYIISHINNYSYRFRYVTVTGSVLTPYNIKNVIKY